MTTTDERTDSMTGTTISWDAATTRTADPTRRTNARGVGHVVLASGRRVVYAPLLADHIAAKRRWNEGFKVQGS